MDKNQVTGIVLITALMLLYFMYFGQKSSPQTNAPKQSSQTDLPTKKEEELPDSVKQQQLKTAYGELANLASGEEKEVVAENKDIKVTFSSKGGKIKSVLLKHYLTDQKKPLYLIDESNSTISLLASSKTGNLDLSTLFYQAETQTSGDTTKVTFKASLSPGNEISQTYSLAPEGYLVQYNLKFDGMNGILLNQPVVFDWKADAPKVEYDLKQSRITTSVNYYTVKDGFDHLSETSNDPESATLNEPIKWVSMKQKFFNAGFIAENEFLNGTVKSEVRPGDTTTLKHLEATVTLPYNDLTSGKGNYSFYFGPNAYQTLKAIPAPDYDKNVYLGWPVINLINRFIVIPVFNFFERYIGNYGVIIIILVFLLKAILFPLSYKSYISMAKMKVLKPEIDEIKERHGDDMQKVQAEQMQLYQKVGINPLSGCIPLLLQTPILLAMFNFFPNSIELRQEPFLWAKDLSTYDSIFSWTTHIWGLSDTYGNHFSLFTFLMTLSTLLLTWVNNQASTVTGPMKSVSYIMPVVFMFVLNSFPAGLSFYYLVSNLVSIGQQFIIKRFVDEDKIRAVLEENRKKYATTGGKKSKWMQRVEEAMKLREEELKKKRKK
jgi:YidC/Oxa1 family membrane protein insertase